VVRHGEVDWLDRYYGQSDVPLSPRGHDQARATADRLSHTPISAVYSSDLQRALFGAQLVAEPRGLTPIVSSEFREMHLGVLEGLHHERSREQHPELSALSYRDMVERGFPAGENLHQVAERVLPAIDPIRNVHAGETIVLVAHNSVNRIVLSQALGLSLHAMFDFRQDFGCINRIDYGHDHTEVSLLNWTPDAP